MSDESKTTPPSSDNRELAPLLGDALAHVVRRLLEKSRSGLESAALAGRTRLEIRQVQSDLDHFWQRLGKSTYHLVQAGEVDHPALRKAMLRIDALESQMEILRHQGASPEPDEPQE